MRLKIRRAELADLKNIIEVERLAWSDNLAASESMFRSRIQTFPEGVLVAEDENSRLIGVVACEIVNYNFERKEAKTWYELTDNGYIRQTHDHKGNVVFGVDLSVVPDMQNQGIATKLLEEIGKIVIKKNIQFAMLGGRIPGYHKHAMEMTPTEYVNKKLPSGEFLDPEVNFYTSAGLQVVNVIPNYFTDPESNNYGVLLLWNNPFFKKNKLIGKIYGAFFSIIFKIKK